MSRVVANIQTEVYVVLALLFGLASMSPMWDRAPLRLDLLMLLCSAVCAGIVALRALVMGLAWWLLWKGGRGR